MFFISPHFSSFSKLHFYIARISLSVIIIIQQLMSEIEHLINLIDGILHATDKTQREAAEANLVQLRSQANQLMIGFLQILAGQYKTEHRNFACTQLRLCLSEFSPASYKNLWSSLTPDNQNIIKTQLFTILFNEPDLSMKKHIADTLGELAGSILGKQGQWPEFKTSLWELFKQQGFGSALAAFHVLQTFLPFAPQTFKDNKQDMFVLFQNGLKSEHPKLQLASLNAFSSYLQVLEPKQQKPFKSLVLNIYEAVYHVLEKDNCNEQGLEALSDMLDTEHKFFKQNFKELNILLQNIFKIQGIESGIKRMATQILVDYSEKSPALFRKNKEYLNNILEMLFVHMVDIDDQISDDWKKPEEGYNEDMEDQGDFETTRFGMGAIDRIIYSVGDKEVLPILSDGIKKLLEKPDWRYQYTAIMALSQVGEYMEDVTHISSIIDMIANYLHHENPMLRYASCHAIGQISDDMQPKFQETYGETLYPKLVQLLADPVPRVISHAAAALTNFLEGMKYDKASPYVNQLMEMLIQHSTNGISLVKESCLSTVSSVAEMCGQNFCQYLEVTVGLLFNIIQTHTSKEYKQLRGQSIETLTIIASSVGAEKFRPAVEKLVNIMIAIQGSNFEQTDPQKTYVLAGWQRLCLVYGQELGAYLDRILPSLFALVQNVINNELNLVQNPIEKEEDDEKDTGKGDSINTFETEEAEVAISMLNVFIEQLKELYAPWVEQTVALLCKIITDHLNEDVREEACKCLPNLVTAIKSSNPQGAVQMTKFFMETLVSTIEKESDSGVIIIQLETLKNVIEDLDMTFLTEPEINAFSQKMLKMLNDSEQNKTQVKKFASDQGNAEELDEEDKEIFDEEIKQEEEVQVAISELIGIIFKTHKDLAVPLAVYLIDNILPSVLKEGLSETTYKFAIFLIDDMVEYLGFQKLEQQWQKFGQVLMGFCNEKSCELRQAACYGLGVYAENTPLNQPEIIMQWIQVLVASSKIPKGSEKDKSYGHCHDNAISSIGKIIKAHVGKFDISESLNYWLSFMPLKYDKPEALIQHEFLVDIMLNKPQMILGNSQEQMLKGIVKVLKLYAQILNNHKIYNDSIKGKMKQHVLSLPQVALFAQHENNIWAALGDKERENIQKLLAA